MLIHIQQEGKLSSGHVSIYTTDGKMIRQLERQSLFEMKRLSSGTDVPIRKKQPEQECIFVYGEFFTTDGEVKEFKKFAP